MVIAYILLALAFVGVVQGFLVENPRLHSLQLAAANGESHSGGDLPMAKDTEPDNLLAQSSSRLSHVMLKVPSVDKTVAYWEDTANGKVTASTKLDDSKDELRSAFLTLGNGKTTDGCFALELVKNKEKTFELGNSISYLGVSKLVQYASKEDLIGVITGTAPKQEDTEEPNGIPVQSCASAPGDFFCRFCLSATNMEATTQFYTEILGMSVAAIDEKMLCLRYESKEKDSDTKAFYGVPTTLVFEPLSDDLDQGNCFDHLAIVTTASISEVYTQVQESLEQSDLSCPLFMKPTEMFGSTVMGVKDPNGYQIILAAKP